MTIRELLEKCGNDETAVALYDWSQERTTDTGAVYDLLNKADTDKTLQYPVQSFFIDLGALQIFYESEE